MDIYFGFKSEGRTLTQAQSICYGRSGRSQASFINAVWSSSVENVLTELTLLERTLRRVEVEEERGALTQVKSRVRCADVGNILEVILWCGESCFLAWSVCPAVVHRLGGLNGRSLLGQNLLGRANYALKAKVKVISLGKAPYRFYHMRIADGDYASLSCAKRVGAALSQYFARVNCALVALFEERIETSCGSHHGCTCVAVGSCDHIWRLNAIFATSRSTASIDICTLRYFPICFPKCLALSLKFVTNGLRESSLHILLNGDSTVSF